MRFTKRNLRMVQIPGVMLLVILALSASAFAQGSITGTVTNSDLSVPAEGAISFVGFLDNTDEEIRLETSVGAGYQSGHWFDDFQNYQTEAPGNPYDFLFFNSANGEGFQLSGSIPNNSFETQDIALGAVAWPAAVTGLTGVAMSSGALLLTWDASAGLTWHVYRRSAASSGSFFRIDDPTGSLANPGVATNYFVDHTVDGASSYTYLLIAEDGSGNMSAHSAAVTVNSAAAEAPVVADINPAAGTAAGGTNVTITGSGFDPAGVTISFGGTPVAATVVSPFTLTAVTPAGTISTSVDVSVTNTASGLTSNTLAGGFTYSPNALPELATIGAQSTTEGVLLEFNVSATDIDGDTPVLSTSTLPGTAAFVDNGDGTGTFTWTPTFTDANTYSVTFYATDGADAGLIDSEIVEITVIEAGNQTPVLASINDTTVAENGALVLAVSATDLDGEIPGLSASGPAGAPLPDNASFVDNANGTGAFTFNPDFTQAGVYTIVFKAVDAALDVDSVAVQVTVTELNQLPVLAAIGAQNGAEDVLLQFAVTASDPDGTIPVLSASTLPGTAVFTDSLNGVGVFEWTPGFTDAGVYSVTFYAADADVPTDIDSEIVVITIGDGGNQAPVLAAITTPQTVAEGGNLSFVITASDIDGTIPIFTAENVPTNASFVDNSDGTGTFDFNPDFTQAGSYAVLFIATDGVLADSQEVAIEVTDGGNVAPIVTPVGDFTVAEGGSLQIPVTANDPDGGAISPVLSVNTTLLNYTFVDNGDGTGLLTYNPSYLDAGIDTVTFFATDFGTPQQTVSTRSVVTTNDVNRPPVFHAAGPFTTAVDDSLIFTITAVDSTDPNPEHRLFLSVVGTLPANAQFTDNGNGTGRFRFAPTAAQVGVRTVTFLAADQGTPQGSVTMPVQITVVAQNHRPVIALIPPQQVTEGNLLTINVAATDPDGTIPVLSVASGPAGYTFVDNGNGTGVFTYTPGFMGGTRLVVVDFRAFDGIAMAKQNVMIQVNDAGNQVPVFGPVTGLEEVTEGNQLVFGVSASDPDGGTIHMIAVAATLPAHVTFVDNGDGTGTITFDPDFTQSGERDITIRAYDGPVDDPNSVYSDLIITVVVREAGNQPPTITPIADRTIAEGATLNFTVTSIDPDGTPATLTASELPLHATFTDNGNGTGSFSFIPNAEQAGVYTITFHASDGEFEATEDVVITVTDVNRPPFVFDDGPRTLYEGETLTYIVTSEDADGTIPFLSAHLATADDLATNMTFTDNRDYTGTLVFTPSYSQGGSSTNPQLYRVVFVATDEDYPSVTAISPTVTFTVLDRNQRPQFTFPDGEGPFHVPEGGNLGFRLVVVDDGVIPPSITAQNMPSANATFTVNGSQGTFTFNPDFTQSGTYNLRFIAVDQLAARDTADVTVVVDEAGNQPPRFAKAGMPDTTHIPVNREYVIEVRPTDPDRDSVSLEAFPILPGATWVDNGDGSGVYRFMADSSYLNNLVEITFVATDHPSLATDTLVTRALVLPFLRGDVDNSGYYNINDVAYLISYLYRDGPPPVMEEIADVDHDGRVTLGDVTYLVYFIWYYGPQPSE